jgi:hypothetical protein
LHNDGTSADGAISLALARIRLLRYNLCIGRLESALGAFGLFEGEVGTRSANRTRDGISGEWARRDSNARPVAPEAAEPALISA